MAKRAQSKPTYPGCLDHLVAGASGRLVRVFIGRFVGVLAIRLDLCLLPCFFFGGGTRSTNGTRNRLFESYMYMYDLNINVYPLHSMYKLLGSYSDF